MDHCFTVEGRICGEESEGIGAGVVSVNDIRADISGYGKIDCDGFYKVVPQLHRENQGDFLAAPPGMLESTGRVDLDPINPKIEGIVTVHVG